MSELKKITKYDLDPELLRELLTSGSSVDLSALLIDYYRKEDVIKTTSIPSDYTDSILEKITAVNNSLNDYRRKSDKIYELDLDAAIINKLDTINEYINSQSGKNEKDYSSQINEIKKIANDSSGVSAQNKENLELLQESYRTINNIVNNNSNSIENIWSALNNYKLKTEAVSIGDCDQEVAALLNKIKNLNTASLSGGGMQISGEKDDVVCIGNENSIISKKLIRDDVVICFSKEEVDAAKAIKEKIFIDVTNNQVYEYDDIVFEEKGEDRYQVDAIEDVYEYNNIFCVNNSTNEVYMIFNGSVYSLNKKDEPVGPVTFNYTVQIDECYELNDARIQFSKINILVLDEETDSETNGEYIPANDLVTLSYTDTGCKIRNKTDKVLNLKIVL